MTARDAESALLARYFAVARESAPLAGHAEPPAPRALQRGHCRMARLGLTTTKEIGLQEPAVRDS
jgi:hypothetical protein